MQITSPRYTDPDHTQIRATVAGIPADFPADPENRHYAALLEAGTTVAAYAAPVPTAAALKAYATAKREEKENSGTTMGPVPVPTHDRAKLLILGAAQTMADTDTSPFVVGGVNYGNLTGLQFQAANAAVVAHVQGTFATLATVIAAIDAGTITTTAAIDEAFA